MRDLLTRASTSLVSRLGLSTSTRRDSVATLTGISAPDWRRIAAAFPELPPEPGPLAARRRERLRRLASRALANGRWNARLEGEDPGAAPTMFVTAHIGALQALRYVLRSRGVPAATVIGRFNLDRTLPVRTDRIFDRRHPIDFPHAVAATQPHRLRSALKRGSLVAAADMPESESRPFPILGGRVRLDPRPFRLARAARVDCRAAFLTLPDDGWTVTISEPLPKTAADALDAFAQAFAEVASRAPLDLDGVVYRSIAEASR